jgi:hypothetical protein
MSKRIFLTALEEIHNAMLKDHIFRIYNKALIEKNVDKTTVCYIPSLAQEMHRDSEDIGQIDTKPLKHLLYLQIILQKYR